MTLQNTQRKLGKAENLTNAGNGRPKGSPNKMTKQVKEMILAALDKAGGIDYLVARAEDQPAAFMTLIGKVLPLQLTGEDGGAIKHEHEHRAAEDADAVTRKLFGLVERAREAGMAERSIN